MKVGDQMVVNLGGFEVAMATIEDISDGKATILIPATRVVMGVRQELAPLNPEVDRTFGGLAETNDPTPSEAAQEQIAASTAESQAAQQVSTEVESGGSLRNMNFDSSAVDKDE